MKITRQNYEIFALDYIEGKLPDDLKKEFESFLNQNPDIHDEINSLRETITVPIENISFTNKHNLKRSHINGLTYAEELIIAEIEGIATEKQKKELREIIKSNPQIAKDYHAYELTRLQAPRIKYPYKQRLKRKVINFTLLAKNAIAYAALLILLLSITTLIKKPDRQIMTSLQLRPVTEQIILLTPADLSSLPHIARPVMIAQKEKISAQQPKQNKHKKQSIITVDTVLERKIVDTKISPKPFNITYPAKQTVAIITPSKPKSNIYRTLSTVTTTTKEKLSSWLNKKGIKLSRREFMIKINDRAYGISVAGK